MTKLHTRKTREYEGTKSEPDRFLRRHARGFSCETSQTGGFQLKGMDTPRQSTVKPPSMSGEQGAEQSVIRILECSMFEMLDILCNLRT